MRTFLAALGLSLTCVFLSPFAHLAGASGDGPPVVHIATPSDDGTVAAESAITFAASAVDRIDGNVGGELVWTSSVDGALGRGATVTRALSSGTHRIRAEVTARDGRQGSETVIVTVVPRDLSFAPVADGYVDRRRPRAALGASRLLHAGPTRESLVRFTVSGLGAARVEHAVLRLTVARKRGAGSKTGARVALVGASAWTAQAVTYRTRPSMDGRPVGAIGRVKPGQVVEVDVTDAVRENGVYTFAVLGAGKDGIAFASREAKQGAPELVLTMRAGGSPSTVRATGGFQALAAGTGDVGYQDFGFGSGVDQNDNRVTAAKPESKLWYQDGYWWGTLWSPQAKAYRFHWLDPSTNAWVDSGVSVDDRPHSRQDVLLAGGKLYVASRFGDSPAQNRLLRYSYASSGRSWALDPGFPVNMPGGGTESMTIARDSRGTLWCAYTLNAQVFVSATTGSDTAWGTPFVIPVAEGTTVDADDIAGVEALQGKIGVFWSNQRTDKFYFAVHTDGASASDPASWQLEVPAAGGNVADDHLNAKLASDGRLFLAVKTSKTKTGETLMGLLVRAPSGTWSALYPVGTVDFNPTRPILLLDETRRRVSVFYSANHTSVRYKESDLDTIAFPDGAGTPFIENASVTDINNPTSTKQGVSPSTGLAVLATSESAGNYWHNAVAAVAPTTTTTTTSLLSTTTTTTTRPSTTTIRPTTTTTRPSTTTTTTRPRTCIPVPGLPDVCL